jgi:hypothetical protein
MAQLGMLVLPSRFHMSLSRVPDVDNHGRTDLFHGVFRWCEGHGGFLSFDGDLRIAYACPQCCQFVWLAGA